MSWTRPRSVSTTRGVKALLTSARSRVWSGGSRNSMDARARTLRPAAEAALEQRLVAALAEPRVAQEGQDVVVPGEDVEPERMAVDGILRPQAMEGRIRVREEVGIEEVQLAHARPPTERVYWAIDPAAVTENSLGVDAIAMARRHARACRSPGPEGGMRWRRDRSASYHRQRRSRHPAWRRRYSARSRRPEPHGIGRPRQLGSRPCGVSAPPAARAQPVACTRARWTPLAVPRVAPHDRSLPSSPSEQARFSWLRPGRSTTLRRTWSGSRRRSPPAGTPRRSSSERRRSR